MLNITGLNRFFFVRDFHDMRCKYDKVLSIIHQQLNREPEDGDAFIVMSKDLRLVRLFSYDRRSYSMFERRFRPGYQFMQVTYNGAEVFCRTMSADNRVCAERFIRPLAGERKNSLFFGSDKMAGVSAVYHTIIFTCRMQGVSVLDYFKRFFSEIVKGRRYYEYLLPLTIGLEQYSIFFDVNYWRTALWRLSLGYTSKLDDNIKK